MSESVDVLIVGGGISGLSLAARLAGKRRIAVVEAENFLGTHATGRSAALLVEAYGPPVIRMLTGLSRPFFEAPPPGFSEAPLAKRRGGLVYGGESQMQRLREEFELASRSAEVEWLDSSEVLMHCPLLRPGVAAAGFLEPNALDLDANGLLQGFVRQARGDGALILTAARVERIQRHGGRWVVAAADREIDAAIVVNAAGAWADAVARLAGVRSLRLQPMRRTAAAIGVPEAVAGRLPAHPFVAPVDESFYFKPDAGTVMVSLSDERPSEPCDAQPDDYDVALALDRFHAATILPASRPIATWAGLRTFAPDRLPVVGFDAAANGFFWYAGQGGYGIQTSPALSALAAKLVMGETLDPTEAALSAEVDSRRAALH